ncbi:MAG: peptidase [Burkholderiaceae bacterium]
MTYCVAAVLDQGLVFLSDSRTNAGMDQISTYRKMTVFERAGDRVIVLLTSGNLSISQNVIEVLSQGPLSDRLWSASSMADISVVVGEALRQIHQRDQMALNSFGLEFNCSFLVGGQIRGERCRLFNVYTAGNFIETSPESHYFQLGESKYGKPVLDRVLKPETSLDDATKCLLISMDSTLKSNLSVGLPLDLLVYETDALAVSKVAKINEGNTYFEGIRSRWGKLLQDAFHDLPDPDWESITSDKSKSVFFASMFHQEQQ